MERIQPSKGHSQTREHRWMGSQDMKRIQLSERHSQTGEHRQTDKSGHRKNLTERGALTSWRVQMDRQVRTWKESNRVRGTHILESTDGQTSQDMVRIQQSEVYSQTGECRWTDKSGQRKLLTEWGPLTHWRVQTDRQLRTWKESN